MKTVMRQDIISVLAALGNGQKPFFEQDGLPELMQQRCRDKVSETTCINTLNSWFESEIAPVIFHSHNLYLAYR